VVLGLGDAPREVLGADVLDHLTDYTFVPDLHRVGEAVEAARSLAHGTAPSTPSSRTTSTGSGSRRTLREALGVRGPTPTEVAGWQSKASMADRFERAGLRPPRTSPSLPPRTRARSPAPTAFRVAQARDRGSGRAESRSWRTRPPSRHTWRRASAPSVAQEVIRGALVTYDGLVDASGRVIFAASLRYAAGVMEFVRDGLDVVYHVRRAIPARVRRSAVACWRPSTCEAASSTSSSSSSPMATCARSRSTCALRAGGASTSWTSRPTSTSTPLGGRRRRRRGSRPSTVPIATSRPTSVAARGVATAARSNRWRVSSGRRWSGSPRSPEAIGAAMGSPIFLVRHEDEATLLEMAARILEPG
jgi:hypothetical protein